MAFKHCSVDGPDEPPDNLPEVPAASVAFLALADPTRLARASRMISVLQDLDLAIDAVCLPPKEATNFRSLVAISSELLGVRRTKWRLVARKAAYAVSVHQPFRRAFRRALDYRYGLTGLSRRLATDVPSLVVTEDIELLPLALDIRAQTGAKVLIDVRDFKWDAGQVTMGTKHRDHWIYQRRLFATYLANADSILAVSDGQRKLMERALDVHPTVIRSTPNYCELRPSQPSPRVIKLIYHGKADRERRLELIIEAAGAVGEKVLLDLVISHSQIGYLDELKAVAKRFDNVRILAPVPSKELIPFANQYDLGVIVYPPSNSNIASALPNKFFELLQSRLGIIVGPGSDMADIVGAYGCGGITDGYDIEDITSFLSSLTPADVVEMKGRAHVAAQELNFEAEGEKLRTVVQALLGNQ